MASPNQTQDHHSPDGKLSMWRRLRHSRLATAGPRVARWSTNGIGRSWEQGNRLRISATVGVVAYFFALFIAFPGTLLHRGIYHTRMTDTLKLAHDLFARDLQEQITAYRLTVPVFLKFLHISDPAVVTVLFQVLPSIATLSLIFFNAARRVGPRTAWPVTLAVSLSFLLFYTFYYGGLFDPITHLCLAIVMTTANPAAAFTCTMAGCFNDERFIIAVPFALLWHFQGGGLGTLIRQTIKPATGVLLGLACAIPLRHAIAVGWLGPGVTSTVDLSQALTTLRPYDTKSFAAGWAVFALNFFMSFRWTWVLVALFFIRKSQRFSSTFKWLLFAALIPPILSAALVMDVAKSIGYLFPAVVFCIVNLITDSSERDEFPKRLWWVVAALMVTPVFCINGVLPAFWLPLPVEGLRSLILGIWGVDVIREWIVPMVHSEKILVPKELWKR